jgi:hypothetical protein
MQDTGFPDTTNQKMSQNIVKEYPVTLTNLPEHIKSREQPWHI